MGMVNAMTSAYRFLPVPPGIYPATHPSFPLPVRDDPHDGMQGRMTDDFFNQILPNLVHPATRFLPREVRFPRIHPSATIRRSKITGDVTVDRGVHIVSARLRADEGTPFYIGPHSNLQSGVSLHGYYTQDNGRPVMENLVQVPGRGYYSIYLGERVTLAHGALVHGPAFIDDNAFVGFKSIIDHARLGKNVEIGANAYVSNVTIPDNTAIAPGAVITKPEDIRKFASPAQGINGKIAHINSELALAYHNSNNPFRTS